MNRSYCSTKRIFHMPFKFTFEVLLENRMWTPILKTNIVRNGLIKRYCVWSNEFKLNKTHTMILKCEADYFHKYWQMQKMSFF